MAKPLVINSREVGAADFLGAGRPNVNPGNRIAERARVKVLVRHKLDNTLRKPWRVAGTAFGTGCAVALIAAYFC